MNKLLRVLCVGSEGPDSHTSKKRTTAAPPLTSKRMCSVVYSIIRVLIGFYSSVHVFICLCLSLPAVSGDCPTLPELLELDIPQWVADQYDSFGTFLLNDETGTKMAIIKNDCRGQAKEITIAALRAWLQGDGTGVSWESLIETLQKCKLPFRAEQIRMALQNK